MRVLLNIKEDKNVLFISLATISINRLWNIFSVNLLNNLQGGKHDKKRKAKSKRKENTKQL